MRQGKTLVVLFCAAAAFLGGTAGRSDPAPEAATYFVIGIAPPFTKVEVSDGHIEDGKFQRSHAVEMWGINAIWGIPQDGYLFVKAEGEPMFGVTVVQLRSSAHAWGGTLYTPCENAGPENLAAAILNTRGFIPGGALVFTPPVGKVTYITDLSFTKDESGKGPPFVAAHQDNLDGARAFLKAHHPEFADRLEQGSYQFMTAAGACK